MKSQLLSQEKNVVTLKMTLPFADFKSSYDKVIRQVTKNANVPGFRKGKAPRKVIENRFGVAALRAEALEELLPDYLDQLINEYELEPIEEPKVTIDTFDEGKDIEIRVAYTNMPEVTLPDLGSIEVEKPLMTITDDMVNDSFEALRVAHSVYEPTTEGALIGDRVRATYQTSIKDDKDKVISSHDPKEQMFNVDNTALRQEVLDGLLGAKAGDHRTAEVRIDESYTDKDLAGNRACYDFDVLEVLRGRPADLDEKFFSLIRKGAKTEEEAKKAMKEEMEKRLARDLRGATESDCLNKVVAGSEVELPESMVNNQQATLLKQAEENVQKRTKLSLKDYYATQNQDYDAFLAELANQAKADVKQYLVVNAAAKEYGIDVTEEDLEAEIADVAEKYGVDTNSVKAMLSKNQGEIRNYYNSARYRKTVQHLLTMCKVMEVEKTPARPEA